MRNPIYHLHDVLSVHNSQNPLLTFRYWSCVYFCMHFSTAETRPASSLYLQSLSPSGLLNQQIVITLTKPRSTLVPRLKSRTFLLSSWRSQHCQWPHLSHSHRIFLKLNVYVSSVVLCWFLQLPSLWAWRCWNQEELCRASGMKKVPKVVWSLLCLLIPLPPSSSVFSWSPTCIDSTFESTLKPTPSSANLLSLLLLRFWSCFS